MKLEHSARIMAETYLEPLCDATKHLLRPLMLSRSDRLLISLDKDGKHFECEAVGVKQSPWQRTVRHVSRLHRIRPRRGASWVHVERFWTSTVHLRARARDPKTGKLEQTLKTDQTGYASYAASKQFFLRLPERRQLAGQGCWWVAGTDLNALIINALWPDAQVRFTTEARVLFEYLLVRFMSQTATSRVRAEFLLGGHEPEFEFTDSRDVPLAPYQRVGLKGCVNQESSALFMEQGTGKTPIVIARFCNEAVKTDHMYKVLVVAPKNVRTNWRNEVFRFATSPGKVCVLRGGQLTRVKELIEATAEEDDCEWSCVIASYEGVTRSWEAIRLVEWDLCVLDESHYIKSPNTLRFKIARKLRERCKQRMCLTGTPITNRPSDLFTQLEFLGEGLSGFTSWQKFKSFYHKYARRGGRMVVTGYQNMPIMQERLARLAFIIRKDQALPDLPEKVYDVIEVGMTPEQTDYYKKVRDQLALEIKDELDLANDSNKQMVVNNILTKLLRLAQITSGFVAWDAQYGDDGEVIKPKSVDRLDPNPKIDALWDILSEKKPEQKTLVWSCWVQDIKSIAARLRLEGWQEGVHFVTFYGGTKEDDRDTAVHKFNNDPHCKVFVGNPAAGGTGLNLRGYDPDDSLCETNCDHEVYFSQNWSMTARTQSEDRVHRRGTRVNVRITDLCVPGTIDEEIRTRVTGKRLTALEIQDVRTLMARVLESVIVENGDD